MSGEVFLIVLGANEESVTYKELVPTFPISTQTGVAFPYKSGRLRKALLFQFYDLTDIRVIPLHLKQIGGWGSTDRTSYLERFVVIKA